MSSDFPCRRLRHWRGNEGMSRGLPELYPGGRSAGLLLQRGWLEAIDARDVLPVRAHRQQGEQQQ